MINIYLLTNNIFLKENNSLNYFINKDCSSKKLLIYFLDKEFISNNRQEKLLFCCLENFQKELLKIGVELNVVNLNIDEGISKLITTYHIEEIHYSRTFSYLDDNILNLCKKNNILHNAYNESYLLKHNEIDIKREKFSFSFFRKFIYDEGLLNYLDNSSLNHCFSKNTSSKFITLKEKMVLYKDKDFLDPYDVLEEFYERSDEYEYKRDMFDYKTSSISPFLNLGVLSVKLIWRKITNVKFRDQLLWREYALHNLYINPRLEENNQFNKMDSFPWENNKEYIEKWKKGETGFLIVDACMKELNSTGYLSNRKRLIVSSFLTRNLLVHWKYGEVYFKEQLIDYKKENNVLGWQWISNCGFNFSFMRLINCETQQKRFDKQKTYFWYEKVDKNIEKIIDLKYSEKRFKDLYFNIKN